MADFDWLDDKDRAELGKILAGLDDDGQAISPNLIKFIADSLNKQLDVAAFDAFTDKCDCAGCWYRRGELPPLSSEQKDKIDMIVGRVTRNGWKPYVIGQLIVGVYAIGVDNGRAEAGKGERDENG